MEGKSWWEERMLSLTVDTTGLDAEKDRIIRIIIVEVGGGEKTQKHSWLIHPKDAVLEPEVAKFNGLTQEQLEKEGEPIEIALAQALKLLFQNPQQAIISFNAKFALNFIFQQAQRLAWLDSVETLKELNRVIDPLIIDKWMFPYRSGSRKLKDICQHYNVEYQEKEKEFAQALTSARLTWKMLRLPQIHDPINTNEQYEQQSFWDNNKIQLEKLFAAQHQWAYYQNMSLAEYYTRKNPDQTIEVETHWPLNI